jgi:hypothetical protein
MVEILGVNPMDGATLTGLPARAWPKNTGEIFLGVAMDKEHG